MHQALFQQLGCSFKPNKPSKALNQILAVLALTEQGSRIPTRLYSFAFMVTVLHTLQAYGWAAGF